MDEYFIEICQQSKTDEIDFQEDGKWKEYHEKKKDNDRPVVEKKKPVPVIHSKLLFKFQTVLNTGNEFELTLKFRRYPRR